MAIEVKAADVMKLRKMTGAGMMDCKKALIEAEGDFERAQDIIREKGKLIVAKRADRNATEGIVVTKIIGTKGYILCLACESTTLSCIRGIKPETLYEFPVEIITFCKCNRFFSQT